MTWRPIKGHPPPEHRLVLVKGPTRTFKHDTFHISAYWTSAYKPRDAPPIARWYDASGFALSEHDWHPTHWMELP